MSTPILDTINTTLSNVLLTRALRMRAIAQTFRVMKLLPERGIWLWRINPTRCRAAIAELQRRHDHRPLRVDDFRLLMRCTNCRFMPVAEWRKRAVLAMAAIGDSYSIEHQVAVCILFVGPDVSGSVGQAHLCPVKFMPPDKARELAEKYRQSGAPGQVVVQDAEVVKFRKQMTAGACKLLTEKCGFEVTMDMISQMLGPDAHPNQRQIDATLADLAARHECAVCEAKTPQLCSGCSMVRYCSVEHQKSDWDDGHKHLCKALKHLAQLTAAQVDGVDVRSDGGSVSRDRK